MWILYDTMNLAEAVREDGTYNTGDSTFSTSSSVTNEERINDQSISEAVSSFDQWDQLRFTLSSAKLGETYAVYSNAATSNNLDIVGSANSNNSDDNTLYTFTSLIEGWNVYVHSDNTYQYWFITSTQGAINSLTELLIGKKTTFDFEPTMGIAYGARHGIMESTTPGNRFHSIRRYDPKRTFTLNWTFINTTFKATLEAMKNTTHGDLHPVLFYDDSNYWYCRMSPDSLNMTEVGFEQYSTTLTLEEI